MRARMPRRMLTSSFSSAARAKSRRSRGQQALRHSRIEEAHRGKRRRPVRVQRLDLVDGRGLEARRTPDFAAGRGHSQLVGDDLHRRREVERRVVGVRGNRGDDAATGELGIGQARHLGAEHEGDVAMCRVPDRLGGRLAHGQHAARELARPRREADGGDAARERRVERRDDEWRRRARPSRPTRARRPPGSGNRRGATSTSRVSAHRQHRARRSADVAGMAGRDQHDADRLKTAAIATSSVRRANPRSSRDRAAVTMTTFVPDVRSAVIGGADSEPT